MNRRPAILPSLTHFGIMNIRSVVRHHKTADLPLGLRNLPSCLGALVVLDLLPAIKHRRTRCAGAGLRLVDDVGIVHLCGGGVMSQFPGSSYDVNAAGDHG